MDALLPDPWDDARVEEHFAVTRLGILASGRMPAERGMVASWLACTQTLLERWAGWGWAVPGLRLTRFDPVRVLAVVSEAGPLDRAREIDALLRWGLDGSLDLCGHLSGEPPAEPFVHEWSSAAYLEPPDWISLVLDVCVVGPVPAVVRRRITRDVVEVVRATVADPRISYAEAGPRSLTHGATPWEDGYGEGAMAAGARLAPRWLRGTGVVTYVHDRVTDALGGRRALGALVDAEVLPSEERRGARGAAGPVGRGLRAGRADPGGARRAAGAARSAARRGALRGRRPRRAGRGERRGALRRGRLTGEFRAAVRAEVRAERRPRRRSPPPPRPAGRARAARAGSARRRRAARCAPAPS